MLSSYICAAAITTVTVWVFVLLTLSGFKKIKNSYDLHIATDFLSSDLET